MKGTEEDPRIIELYHRLDAEAREGGYNLNPDMSFTLELVRGLLTNTERYGYPACPCRLASGVREKDLDIVCPCDYRDPDLDEYGACYCALYVSSEVLEGKRELEPIPDRRGDAEGPDRSRPDASATEDRNRGGFPWPVHRCRVCGYLCAREDPPEVCPICKAGRERFERFA